MLCSWFYGRDLFNTLQYPIGLIESDYGGTPIEAWSSPAALAQCPRTPLATGATPSPTADSTLWNAMVHPLLRTSIKGVVWYQGESDAMYPQSVNCLPTMLVRQALPHVHQICARSEP
jgi:sialate O-acetylesterase